MKRIVGSCGIAPVVLTLSIRDHLKITSGPLEKAIPHTLLLMVLKMKRNASQVLRMNSLAN